MESVSELNIMDLPDEILHLISTKSNEMGNLNLTSTRFNSVIRDIDLCTKSPKQMELCFVKATKLGRLNMVMGLINLGVTNIYEGIEAAIIYSTYEILKYILEHCPIDIGEVFVLIHTLIDHGSMESISIFLETYNSQEFISKLLLISVKKGNYSIVEFLLSNGYTKPVHVNTAMANAVSKSNSNMVKLLLPYSTKMYNKALYFNTNVEVYKLIESKYDIQNNVKLMILSNSIFANNVEMVRLLACKVSIHALDYAISLEEDHSNTEIMSILQNCKDKKLGEQTN